MPETPAASAPAPEINSAMHAEPHNVCPYCHQPILPTYYFCPNCGMKLSEANLSITPTTQAWIYIFSIILPMFCYLFIAKWPGWKYYKSRDPQVRQVGINAIVLLILSTIITFWLATIWVNDAIQSSVNSINADMSAY